jgi:predicted permease
MMDRALGELRQALRWARHSPAFFLVGTLTLGLGIGASTAIFSVVRALLITPLPYSEADRVCFVLGYQRGEERFNVGLAEFLELQDGTRAMSAMGAYRYWAASLSGEGHPERVQGYHVTPGLLDLLGVQPALGRLFLPEEGRPGTALVAVLSHGLWARRFGSDPEAVGRPLRLDGELHTIVGVMPEGFEFPVFNYKGELWSPLRVEPSAARARPGQAGAVVAVGRLGKGLSVARAQADLDRLSERLAAEQPEWYRGRGVRVLPMQELGAREARPALFSLLGAVVAVLMLAAANVAGLLLARGIARQREIAIRAALGATRGRLLGQLLAESLLLAAAGAAFGVWLAQLLLVALAGVVPDSLRSTVPNIERMRLDPATLAFGVGLALAAGVGFGLLPALRASQVALLDALRSGARALGGRPQQRARTALVVGQVAASLALLVGAGLALRSFEGLLQEDLGFEPGSVVTFAITLPESRYPDAAAVRDFQERLLPRLSALPGAESVGAVNTLPFSTYDSSVRYAVAGEPPPEPGREPRADIRPASPGYLGALGIALLRGRGLESRDSAGAAPVAVVNARFVESALPGPGEAIGRRILLAGEQEPREIVGVVGNVRHSSHAQAPDPEVYVPLAQSPERRFMVALRARGPTEALAAAARGAVWELDPEQPIYHVGTLQGSVQDNLLLPRLAVLLASLFGASALVLAMLGLYGLASHLVSAQIPELGVRMALGASRRDVGRLVLGRGVRPMLLGLALGAVGAAGLARAVSGLLYGVRPMDPWVHLGAIVILAGTALLVTAVPARRAARVEPMRALRVE